MPTGTHTNPWTDDHLDGATDTGSVIDDEMNKLSKNVRERLVRGGLFVKDASDDGRQAVAYTSPNAYHADEWNVYGKDASGEPDISNKLLSIDSSGNATIKNDLTVSGSSGTISGSTILTEGTSKKRLLILTINGKVGSAPEIDSTQIVFPKDYSGSLVEFTVSTQAAASANRTVTLTKTTPTRSGTGGHETTSDTASGGTTIYSSSAAIPTGDRAMRAYGAALSNTTFSGGELIRIVVDGGGDNHVTCNLVFEIDY